jgi:hypothetical protein
MKKTIELTPKSTKWFFVYNGVVNTAIGINSLLLNNSWIHWTSILGIILIVSGPILFIYGLILFRPSNTIIPRITINERGLIIKGDIFKKVISIDWTDVKEITYRSFALDLKLSDKSIKTLDLPTTADKSIEIKKSIREICDNKNITIEGG